MRLLAGIIIGYLMGSVPFGLLIARLKGVDLRSVGSGNIGATNVLRGVGKWPAIFTLLGDILKGAAAVALGKLMGLDVLGQGLMGLAAVIGHDFSVVLGFKGGKGVATSLGLALAYSPEAGLSTIAFWLITAVAKRYSSLAAVVSFALFPAAVFIFERDPAKTAVACAAAVLIMIRHSGNIKRLLEGRERKIGEKA